VPTSAVITLSDKGSRGLRPDESGPAVVEILVQAGYEVKAAHILPDERQAICDALSRLSGTVDLIVTTGGTGLSPRDVTPEATLSVIEQRVPGIPEAMRAAGMLKTQRAMLSRAEAGILRDTLIINLPGSRKAAVESLEAVIGTLGHAIEKIKGSQEDCGVEDKKLNE
jgi:molybdenum cofactor synthesis domain-containing protein